MTPVQKRIEMERKVVRKLIRVAKARRGRPCLLSTRAPALGWERPVLGAQHDGGAVLEANMTMKTNEPTITYFNPDNAYTAVTVDVTVWFRRSGGGNAYTNLSLYQPPVGSPDEFLTEALRYKTQFVKDQWFLIEASTPLVRPYGREEGGLHVFRATREVA